MTDAHAAGSHRPRKLNVASPVDGGSLQKRGAGMPRGLRSQLLALLQARVGHAEKAGELRLVASPEIYSGTLPLESLVLDRTRPNPYG
jgi:hypothetical protein